MTSPNVPRNAYTDAPEQHPNLILGSLQLLFWLFFHPSAWLNHLARINPALLLKSNKPTRLHWRDKSLWRLLLQAYLILPTIVNLIVGLLLLPNISIINVLKWMALSLFLSLMVLGFISISFAIFKKLDIFLFGHTSEIHEPNPYELIYTLEFKILFILIISIGINIYLRLVLIEHYSINSPDFGLFIIIALALIVSLSVTYIVYIGTSNKKKKILISQGKNYYKRIDYLVNVILSPIIVPLALLMLGVLILLFFVRPFLLYPFLILWNNLLYWLDTKSISTSFCWLRYHSSFWDEWQYLRLYGLDKHLVFVIQHNPDEGKAALNYLSNSRQRWAAQAVQIELDARELENCADVAAISNTHHSLAIGELNSPVSSTLLSSFSHISQDAEAALNQGSAYNQRLALSAVAEKLNGLIRELTRSSDKYSVRFRPIATQWYEIVTNHIQELTETVELRQEIDNPYIIGVPLTEQQEIFTGRTDIGTRIEQLILDRRRPPLLLYGQRRMGKTSLLNNLGRLLPNSIIPMFVDLQGPVSSASDYAGFLYNIARAMIDSAKRQSAVTLPPLTREDLAVDPFTSFDEWLDKVEQTLDQNIALLSLDEFEALDDAISKGRFDEQDVLGMLRHLIQHRPRFKLLLAGSHTIEEFQRWASYLINVQVLHISYLKEPEARQLIERPVKDFTLHYEPDAVERVLQLTRCHPFLVQLLCAEIIYLKNEQDPSVRRLATLADVEAAVPAALEHGSFFFADIQNNQVGAGLADNPLSQINHLSTKPALTDGLAVLRFIAAQGEGAIVSREILFREFPDNLDNILELLLRRELIEEIGEGYRFQVELIRRWF